MSKGEMTLIVTISWIARSVMLALVLTLTGVKPSDLPRQLLLILWLAVSKIIHAVLAKKRRKWESGP